MSELGNELLMFARGSGFDLAVIIFLFGILIRVLEIVLLGRKVDLAKPRADDYVKQGYLSIFRRFLPMQGLMKEAPVTVVAGYIFHVGFILVMLFYIPHIEQIKATIGLSWPGISTPVMDFITVITIMALIALLADRLVSPVKRLISTREDYITWLVTFLPMVTGYFAYHHMLLPYAMMLALHLLSVELLLVVLPFTKLSHMFTFFISRYYTGEMFGKRGVEA
uniref:Nitrate reductase n=1 Tax=Magnetococcus massalia (strain MO-1) TaxID=451514 RepID=A0A1S7LFW5_MAGMO|nr:conserved protein of unknown function [Candidatus Magnetococcus massalia]